MEDFTKRTYVKMLLTLGWFLALLFHLSVDGMIFYTFYTVENSVSLDFSKHSEPRQDSRRPAEPAEEDIDNKSYHHTICRRLDRIPYQILPHSILVNKIDRYTYHNVQ